MATEIQATRFMTDLSLQINDKVENFSEYHDGFSFTTLTELGAYKAAYAYQGCKRVNVKFAPNVNAWLVQVYRNN